MNQDSIDATHARQLFELWAMSNVTGLTRTSLDLYRLPEGYAEPRLDLAYRAWMTQTKRLVEVQGRFAEYVGMTTAPQLFAPLTIKE